MKVLFITNVPSPYRVDFFNELGKSCELTVLFEKRTSDERDKSWKNYKFFNFTGVFLNGKSVNTDTAICPNVVKYVKKRSYDHIVVTNVSSPTGMIAIQYMKLHHIPYWIEGDGAFAKSGKGIKERLKKHFLSGAKGYFSTSKAHDEYYMTYGADPKRIFRYPFTSISKEYILQAQTFSSDDKAILRRELGMTEKYIILSVGRFSYQEGYGKGYDVLMRLAEKMGADYGFYLVGDEPTEEFKRWKDEKGLDNVNFVGFKLPVELVRYYAAADVFALLSRGEAWGLVLNEAMAYGLPIVASDKCVAATELINAGENGFVLPIEDENEIAEKLKLCIENRDTYGIASLNKIEKYTTEAMAQKHVEILWGGGVKRNLIRYVARAQLGLTQNRPIVLFVGQLIYRKGIDVLIRSAARCGEVDFYIVGGNPTEEYISLMQELSAKNVYFVDFKKPQELRRFYQAADLFVLPTRKDIWGLVINEAMANGLPVITTDRCVAGLELVRNGCNGYVVPAGEVEPLVSAIHILLNDNRIDEFGKNSRMIIQHYTIEEMALAHVNTWIN